MSQNVAPNQPLEKFKFINLDTGRLTSYGVQTLEQMFNQVAAGFVIVACNAVTAANVITLTPRLHREGARTYGQHMAWAFTADVTTTAAVTAKVTDGTNALATIKVYKSNGAAQAGNGDIVAASTYLLLYDAALDGGAGGLVLK